VAYTVQRSAAAIDYLRALPGLTRQGRIILQVGIFDLLRNHCDELRSDPSRRLAPGSARFRFDFVFRDAGRFWRADCIADDSAVAYGVIRLEYLDCQPGA